MAQLDCITCGGAGVYAIAGVPQTIPCGRCGGTGLDPEPEAARQVNGLADDMDVTPVTIALGAMTLPARVVRWLEMRAEVEGVPLEGAFAHVLIDVYDQYLPHGSEELPRKSGDRLPF